MSVNHCYGSKNDVLRQRHLSKEAVGQQLREAFKSGKFTFLADGCSVIVTKDTSQGIVSIGYYEYKNFDEAADAAWEMSQRQSKA